MQPKCFLQKAQITGKCFLQKAQIGRKCFLQKARINRKCFLQKKLASVSELQRNTVIEYLNHLHDAGLLSLLYSDALSIKKMQRPDKIFLDNPNMLYALANTPVQIGTARECFVVNQLNYGHTVEYGKAGGDFKVDGKWTFEVGGEKKSFAQIADLPNSFVLADDIESPRGNKLPLWMMGFLY